MWQLLLLGFLSSWTVPAVSVPAGELEFIVKVPAVKLLDGNSLPLFGLGLDLIRQGPEAQFAIDRALELGCKMFDVDAGNEHTAPDVGRSVRESNTSRQDIFVQAKLEIPEGRDAKTAVELVRNKVKAIGLDYLDLFLVNIPSDNFVQIWEAMLTLQGEGLLRSLGLLNHAIPEIEALVETNLALPVVIQVKMKPNVLPTIVPLTEYCRAKGLHIQLYLPIWFGMGEGGPGLADTRFQKVADSHPGKSTAQIALQYTLQRGFPQILVTFKRTKLLHWLNIFDKVSTLSNDELTLLDEVSGLHAMDGDQGASAVKQEL